MIAIRERWDVRAPAAPDAVASLARALNLPPTLAGLLVQRGYTTAEAARSFLRPS